MKRIILFSFPLILFVSILFIYLFKITSKIPISIPNTNSQNNTTTSNPNESTSIPANIPVSTPTPIEPTGQKTDSPQTTCTRLAAEFIVQHKYSKSGLKFSPKVIFNTKLKICFLEVELSSPKPGNDGLIYYYFDLYDLTHDQEIASYQGNGDGDPSETPTTTKCVLHGTKDYQCGTLDAYAHFVTNIFN